MTCNYHSIDSKTVNKAGCAVSVNWPVTASV